MEPGFLSRVRSEDSADQTISSRRSKTSRDGITPVKVVTRLRPLRSGERKQAVFADWSSVKLEDDDEEEVEEFSNTNVHHQQQQQRQDASLQSASSSPFSTPQRKSGKGTTNHHQDQDKNNHNNGGSGIAPPSASRIPTLSRSHWNRPQTKGIPTSLIVESSNLSPGPSHTQARVFSYDAVLTPDVSQAKVYQQTVGNAVRRNLFRGYNTTICAYGQVASGKSYTMYGPPRDEYDNNNNSIHSPPDNDKEDLVDETIDSCTDNELSTSEDNNNDKPTIRENDGIMPRALKEVFDAITEFSEKEVSLEMTFMEIYRDEIRDLLADRSPHLPLQLYDHEQGNVVVHGLRSVPVYSLSQALKMIAIAQRRRTQSQGSSHVSSRSHAICTLHVTLKQAPGTTNATLPAAAVVGSSSSLSPKRGWRSKLTLVDLAGSERLVHTPTSARNKISHSDAITINKDLFVLGKVVAALASPPVGHVPYRDSKLTRILRDSLGGNCCTVFVACVSPAEINLEESLHTLRYAARAQSITHTVRRNVLQSPLSAHDASFLRAENQRLKARLDQYEVGVQMTEFSSLQSKLVKAEQEAQRAREHAKSVRRTADKWKEQFEKVKVARSKMNLWRTPSVSSSVAVDSSIGAAVESSNQQRRAREIPKPKPSKLTVKTNLQDDMDDDLDALLGDDPGDTKVKKPIDGDSDALLDDDSETRKELTKDPDFLAAGIAVMTQDMNQLSDEKVKLAEQVAELNQFLADQRSKMLALEEDYSFRQAEMTAYMAKQEKQRDELDEEVERLKQKVHLLATDLKQEGTGSATDIFRPKNDTPETPNRSELEMQTWRLEKTVEPNEETSLEASALKQQLIVKEMECRDLQDTVDRLTAENLSLHEENDKLRVALHHHGKEHQPSARKYSSDVSLGSAAHTVGTADNDMFISNLHDMMKQGVCVYELSPLVTNSTQIDFYLPKLKVFCPCGKHSVAEDTADFDPTALASILRPWQLEFLESCAITHTIHLLQAARHRASEVASKMRKWRRRKKLPTFHTPSCTIAVHIWSRTCIRVLKAVHQQKAHGRTKPVMPDFMEYKLDPDLYTVSSMGQLSHPTGTVVEDEGTKATNHALYGVPESAPVKT